MLKVQDWRNTIFTADLPGEIPIFPLTGALLLPRGNLPLNIFEPRYVAMVDDAMKGDRLIGMIQPRPKRSGPFKPRPVSKNDPASETSTLDACTDLYSVGCAGRITSYEEHSPGRYLITLTGISRFSIIDELTPRKGYRRILPEWDNYGGDLKPPETISYNRTQLKDLLCKFLEMHNMNCDWDIFDQATDEKLITCLSMICPLEPGEKQALMEADSFCDRAKILTTMIDMAVHGQDTCHKHH